MHTRNICNLLLVPILATAVSWTACSQRKPGEPIEPGFNVYSKEQDIQIGREAAAEVRKQVDVVDNVELQNYISEVGQKLASQPAAKDYPYSFTLINEESINAFALPGGPIFVHTDLLKAADNEAQLAGVLAHEIAHVALRHGTNQASKANLVQLPAVLAGAAIGSGSVLAQLGQLGLGFGLNSLLLKYSRDAERQADALGARLMARAGYNPLEMAHVFEKLEAQGGSSAPEFLSSHPNPGNRVKAVQAEIQALPQSEYHAGTGEFRRAKTLVAQLPPPDRKIESPAAPSEPHPSPGSFRRLELSNLSLAVPTNWRIYGDRGSPVITMAPQGGLVQTPSGTVSIGYGAVVSYYHPRSSRSLNGATQELIDGLRSVNPGFGGTGRQRKVQLNGKPGLMTTLYGNSPYGGPEQNILITVARPEGLFYMVFVAPQSHVTEISQVSQAMLDSVRFSI
jgi:hypothetical protein